MRGMAMKIGEFTAMILGRKSTICKTIKYVHCTTFLAFMFHIKVADGRDLARRVRVYFTHATLFDHGLPNMFDFRLKVV
jgi:hypothetical protein